MPHPNVYVNERLASYVNNQPSLTQFVPVFVGRTAKGPLEPVLVNSWPQFQATYGGLTAVEETSVSIYQYFANGGARCYVQRVLADDAVTATEDIILGTPVGASDYKVTVDAASPGTWGNGLTVRAVGTPDTDVYMFEVSLNGVVMERWDDVSLASSDSRFIEAVINSPVSGSQYIRVTVAGSSGVLDVDPVVLTTGDDGAVPASDDYLAGVKALRELPSLLLLCVPDAVKALDATNYAALVNGVVQTIDPSAGGYSVDEGFDRNVFFIADAPPWSSSDPVYDDFLGGISHRSSYVAAYAPWVRIPDPQRAVAGVVRQIPPSGSVAGKYVTSDTRRGVGKTPAGLDSKVVNCLDIEKRFRPSELDSLNESGINVIRPVPGSGFAVMGGRTLIYSAPDRYVSIRRSLQYLTASLRQLVGFAIFENNTPMLRATVKLSLVQFLNTELAEGTLKGTAPQDAYYIVCDESNNPPNVIAQGEIRVEVGVALASPAEFIVITLIHYEGGSVSAATSA